MPAHVFLAHFPFALIVTGACADVLGALLGRPGLRRWAGTLLILGGIAAFLTFFTGSNALPGALARPSPDYARIEAHTQWGGAGVWLLVAGGLLRAAWREHLHGAYGWATLAAAVLSAGVVIGVAISGHAIAHAG